MLVLTTIGGRRSNFLGTATIGVIASTLQLLLLLAGSNSRSGISLVSAINPYSSNVVALTSENWKEEVVDSPHPVLINICRNNQEECQLLEPDWESLALSTNGIVTIAYWDTQSGSTPPRLMGEYEKTPLIRLFTPKEDKEQKTKGSYSEKLVHKLDYTPGDANMKHLKKFLEQQIPNYVERIRFGVDEYYKIKQEKADMYGLPIALLFTSKLKPTSKSIKWLSTEYRHRMVVVEIPPVEKNSKLWDEIIGSHIIMVDDDDDDNDGDGKKLVPPALYIIPPSSSEFKVITFEGDDYKRSTLQDFFNEHSLKEPVFEPIIIKEPVVKPIITKDEGNNNDDTTATEKPPLQPKEDSNDEKEEASKEKEQHGLGVGEL